MRDARQTYDKALETVNDALDGKDISYTKLSAAIELLKMIMMSIFNERSVDKWSDTIRREGDDDAAQ